MVNRIMMLYHSLLNKYGPQGWWPISGKYHPNDFSYPKNDAQRFEICIGAILTQNTSWKNVEKALSNLDKKKLITAKKLVKINHSTLASLIKPAGYFNQKAKKIKIFSDFFLKLGGRKPYREELLELWGIGPETADSILLYAYDLPEFVVDAYTKRILLKNGLIDDKATYDSIKKLFESNTQKDYELYQEFHALLVENGKRMR